MSTYSDFRSAVRIGTLKVLQEFGYPTTQVIYSHQNGSEPSTPYVVIQIVSLNQVGRNESSTLTDESSPSKKLTIKATYEGRVQFMFCGSTAPDMAQDFTQAICNNIVVTEAYQRNNLAPMRKGNVTRSPQKRDTGWVEFFTTNVVFSYAIKTTQDIDWVEHVTILDENSGEIITIPPL